MSIDVGDKLVAYASGDVIMLKTLKLPTEDLVTVMTCNEIFNPEKPDTFFEKVPKGHLAVPSFYFYRREDVKRIPEALAAGCGADAPGILAACLSRHVPMHAFVMPGKRYDVGDVRRS